MPHQDHHNPRRRPQFLEPGCQVTDSTRDIGNLIKEAQADIEKECADEIKDGLYRWVIARIRRACVHGVTRVVQSGCSKFNFNPRGNN